MPDIPDVTRALAAALDSMNAPSTIPETLQAIVVAARSSLVEIDHAGITLAQRNARLVTDASTDPLVGVLDQLQYDLGQGPCLEALSDQGGRGVVVAEHLRDESRWRDWVLTAVPYGVRSVLAVALHTGNEEFGVLSMYSTSSDVLSEETRAIAPLLAAEGVYAYGYTRQICNLETALESRELIGNAVGVVMERYGLDSAGAFEFLVRAAATSNIKIRVIAEALLDQAPEGSSPDRPSHR